MTEIFLDAITDTVKMIPFLFIAYVVIEYIEHCSSENMGRAVTGFGRFGAVGGALLGCVPQCGFSAAASNLYSNRLITTGTLVAVFLSTSDEAIPVLLSYPEKSGDVFKLIFIKIIIAAVAGIVVDLIFKTKVLVKNDTIHSKHSHCRDGSRSKSKSGAVFISALKHTVQISAFIFVLSFALGACMEHFGNDVISKVLLNGTIFEPMITAVIGFVPNCAASVLLTQLYIDGAISFGSLVAGLCTGAGVGLAVLFKENKPISDSFKIMGIVYAASVVAGWLMVI